MAISSGGAEPTVAEVAEGIPARRSVQPYFGHNYIK